MYRALSTLNQSVNYCYRPRYGWCEKCFDFFYNFLVFPRNYSCQLVNKI